MDLFTIPFSLLTTVCMYVLNNFGPILLGAVLMLIFAVLFIQRNLKTRPEWVFALLSRYASKLEPVQTWYERMHRMLLISAKTLEGDRKAKADALADDRLA